MSPGASPLAAASLLLGALLSWVSAYFPWIALGDAGGKRVLLLAAWMAVAAVLYFGVLRMAGLRVGSLVRR